MIKRTYFIAIEVLVGGEIVHKASRVYTKYSIIPKDSLTLRDEFAMELCKANNLTIGVVVVTAFNRV